MGLIEKFIELTEEHPRPLLLTLLGVIIVGGTGGGIWISNLQSSVEERDKIISQRLALQEHQFRADLRVKSRENVVLREEVKSLRSGIEHMQATVAELSSILGSPHQGSKNLESGELTKLSSVLKAQSKDLELALIKADAVVGVEEQLTEGPASAAPLSRRIELASIFLLLLVLAVVLMPLLILYLWRVRSSELLRLRRQLALKEGQEAEAQPRAVPDDARAGRGRPR